MDPVIICADFPDDVDPVYESQISKDVQIELDQNAVVLSRRTHLDLPPSYPDRRSIPQF